VIQDSERNHFDIVFVFDVSCIIKSVIPYDQIGVEIGVCHVDGQHGADRSKFCGKDIALIHF
jgi:hypothetical protein